MRENKYDKLLFASITMLVVSTLVLLFCGYNFYFKSPKKSVIQKAPTDQPLDYINIQLKDSTGKNSVIP